MFFHALAAMLFAAVCAWCAHSLYTGLAGTALPVPTPQPAESPAPGTFRGVLLRREETVSAAAFPEARAGERLNAGRTGTESALFFPESDAWVFLSPDDAARLSPERLEALLASDAGIEPGKARLVYGFEQLCAALYEGEEPPAPGQCRLRLKGFAEEIGARLLSVSTDPLGQVTLLIRLVDFPQELYSVRFVEGEIAE